MIDNDDEFTRGADRELTLSTASLLGIFAGLVLLCGGFFGFGYKMGSHKVPPPVAAEPASAEAAASDSPGTDFSGFKPAAGSPASESANTAAPAPAARATTVAPGTSDRAGAGRESTPTAAAPHSSTTAAPTAEAPAALRSAPAPIVRATPPPSAASLAASLAATPPAAASGSFVVQVAAVSLQEDADLLAGALRGKGYTVSERAQPDKLIHIQVGPFSNHKDAEAMRQRLLADGYNALVK